MSSTVMQRVWVPADFAALVGSVNLPVLRAAIDAAMPSEPPDAIDLIAAATVRASWVNGTPSTTGLDAANSAVAMHLGTPPSDEGTPLAAWPVGSIHLRADALDPAQLFGGTWAAIAAGRLLLGLDGTHPLGSTGGSSTPAGSVAAPVFTGAPSQATSAVSGGTPAGSCSAPTFTGAALAAHAHELPLQIPSPTTTRQLAAATFGTGTSRAATAVSATGTANTTSAAVALSEAKSAGTPTGTVSAPTFTGSALATHQHTLTPSGTVSAPTFTGTPSLPPYLAVAIWQRTA